MRTILLTCLLVSILQLSKAQKPNLKFEHLTISSGLSQNNVLCVFQDRRGFIWFGTRDGLNKYDGYRFTIYRNDPKNKFSISNNFVTAITEDNNGHLWIATDGGGLNRYNREKDQFDHFMQGPGSISSNLLVGLMKDHEGNLWISTEDAGINYLNVKTNKIIQYHHLENDAGSLCSENTHLTFEDSHYNIWVGSYDAGLDRFNPKTRTFTHFPPNGKDNALSGADAKVIFEDSKGRIWIGTTSGLNLFDPSTGGFQHFFAGASNSSLSGNVIAAIGEDRDHNLWIGTENNGLNIYDHSSNIFYRYMADPLDENSINHNSIYSIYRDHQDNMWVGTFAGGVNLTGRHLFAQYRKTSDPNSLSHNNVLSISEGRNGKLWIGTDGGGLNLFDPITKNFTHFKHEDSNPNTICGNYVLTALEDSRDNLWIGTWSDGITLMNMRTHSYRHFGYTGDSTALSNPNVWVIFEDHEKNIWIGTHGGGLHLFDYKTNSFKRYDDTTRSVVARQIYSIAEDEDGNLWIGTNGDGIRIFNKKLGFFKHIRHSTEPNSLIDNHINHIYRDEHNNFWISTATGLCFYNSKTGQFTNYTTEDGLPNNVTFATQKDNEGNLWISTNRGLSRLNLSTNQFTNYSISDGLQSYEFKGHAVCKSSWGAMYFGGINGFNEFIPENIREEKKESPLVFTDFQIFNKKVPIASDSISSPLQKDISETKVIRLPESNSVISFEFASLDYNGKEHRKYSYMLEGFDKEWNMVDERHTATYTNLDPGTYLFKVRALNPQGQWSSREAQIILVIVPPFWKTWWFKTLVVISLLFSVLAYYRMRMNRIQKQKEKLQVLVEEKTEELVRKNRELEQFAYVASHDLQEPLRTISSFVDVIHSDYKDKFDAKADKCFSFILQSTERMKILIRDLLEYSRIGRKKEISEIDCMELANQVAADLTASVKENKAEINFEALPVISGYPTEMKQLFQNLITNAIKFQKPGNPPVINISADKKNGSWEFIFKDNGIGIAKEHSERIFIIFQRLHTRNEYEGSGIGLANCKKIVELHGGNIWVNSEPGEGSAFHFTIGNISNSHERYN